MRTLLVVFVLAFIAAALAQNSCTLDDYKKVDCGGSSQSNCNQKGCWVPAYSGSAIPWCFYGANHTQSVPIPPPALPGAPFTSANVNTMFQYFLANINIDGLGGVVASPDNSTPGGSYYYHWERDGALSMNALQLVSSFSTSLPLMQSYVKWVLNVQSEPDPNGIDVRVEPKYNLPYGDVYSGSWCRPQTDGPGLRAITLITFANNMLAQSSSTYMSYVKQYLWTGNQNSYHGGAIKYDLDWIVSNWAQNGCDLWEEIQSTDFFWNRFTMKAALFLGSTFAQTMGDSQSSSTYLSVAQQINATLGNHWNGNFVFESSNRKEDSAVILAFNNGYSNDGYFAPNSEYVTGTVNTLNYMFYTAYPINFQDSSNGVPGILYGRYQGDTYAGGNPWILTTCSLAQLFYRGATAVINNAELPHLNAIRHYQEIFSTLLRSTHQVEDLVKMKPLDFARLVASAGDAVLNRINYHVKGAGFHLAEQLDKNTGIEISATDLTWSYATALKAMWYRDNFSNVVQSVHRGDKSIHNDPFFAPVHWKN